MKVNITHDGLIVAPETAFEGEYLRQLHNKKLDVFLKHGLSVKDLMGLKIKITDGKEDLGLMSPED